MATEMKTYRVVYEPDESGHWIASVPSVRGCHTYGTSIKQARERIREALGLFVENVETVKLDDVIKLPAEVQRLLRIQSKARAAAERKARAAQDAIRRSAMALTKGVNLSVRDAGEIMQMSHQRIQQVLAPVKTRRATKAPRAGSSLMSRE
jgi:predicted RNase H-like HicB family nuclease